MESFAKNQEQMRSYMKESFGGMFPMDRFEEMSKQNMAFFEQAMRMWNPFKAGMPGATAAPAGNASAAPKAPEAPSADEINDLKAQMSALQRQIEALTKAAGGKGE
jgi:polyhydroxyalkanoate synthesis regulator protein